MPLPKYTHVTDQALATVLGNIAAKEGLPVSAQEDLTTLAWRIGVKVGLKLPHRKHRSIVLAKVLAYYAGVSA